MRRLAASLFVPVATIALMLASQATASAQARLRVTFPEHRPALELFDGALQAVGRIVIEAVPHGGQNSIDMVTLEVREQGNQLQHVTQVAFGIDTNDDGMWQEGVDAIDPRVPVAYDNGSGYFHYPPGANVMVRKTSGAAIWIVENTGLVFEAGQPQEWFVLYAVNLDAPLDIEFTPCLPEDGGALNGWSAKNPFGGGYVHTTLAVPGSQYNDGIVHFDYWYIDYNLGVWGYTFSEETEPLPDDLSELDDWAMQACLPSYQLEGIGVTPNPLPDGQTVLAGEQIVMADITMTGFDPEDEAHTPEALTVEPATGDGRHIAQVQLVHDVNADGVADETDTWLGTADGFPGGIAAVALDATGAPALNVGETARYLVVATMGETLSVNMRYSLRVSWLDAGTSPTAGLPLDFEEVIGLVERNPQLLAAFDDEDDREVLAGEELVLASLVLDALDTTATVSRIRLRATGSGDAGIVVESVDLYHDVYRDGQVDGSDTLLASGSFVGGDATFDITGSAIGAGGRLQLMVVVTLTTDATVGSELGVELVSVVTVEDVPVTGVGSSSATVTVAGAADDDPEFDPAPVGPFTIDGAGAGCSTGAGSPSLAALALLAGLLLVAWRRRA